MRSSLLAFTLLFVSILGDVREARADNCCTCTGESNVNPKDNKKRTFGGGWLSNEAACTWFCTVETKNPSHSWQKGEKCEKPKMGPPPPKVPELLLLCHNTDSNKNIADKGQCDGACGQIKNARDSCIKECGDNQGCREACSGGCSENGCHAACTGAEQARRLKVFENACHNNRPCDGCEQFLKDKENECVRQCWDKGCENTCHSICLGNDSARSGACNHTRQTKPECQKPPRRHVDERAGRADR